MPMSKIWPSLLFEKRIFPAKNAGNMLENRFLAISRDLIIRFFQFFAQRCILAMLITWPSPIFDKNSFPAENAGNMLEIAVPADFLLTFSTYFVVLFYTKTLVISLFCSFVRSHARSPRSFVLSLSGRSNQHVACLFKNMD